jgi:hypothetical protein
LADQFFNLRPIGAVINLKSCAASLLVAHS